MSKEEIENLNSGKELALIKKLKISKKYNTVKELGKGGMGTISLALDNKSQRKVAIKTLNPGLMDNREAVIRFSDEAQITAQIEHPNIIPVYEFALNEDRVPFYSMKHVHGTNLKEILSLVKEKNEIILEKFHLIELLSIFVKICDAMAAACSKMVLHRDLKPENIMIGEFGEVLIVDWGLAKVIGNTTYDAKEFNELYQEIETFVNNNVESLRSINRLDLTLNDCLIGTPQYMSPERITGEGDERSEVFSLGTILYDILALDYMFSGEDAREIIQKITQHKFKPLGNFYNLPHLPYGRVPQALIAVVDKATQQDPSKRYQSILELKNEIESYIQGFATQAERAGFFKLLGLGIKRNRKLSLLVSACFLSLITLSTFFIMNLQEQKQDANNALLLARELQNEAQKKEKEATDQDLNLKIKISQLKQQAPILYENARYELGNLDFANALRSINYAVDLEGDNPHYHFLRGKIQLCLLWFEDAAISFTEASKNPELKNESIEFLKLANELSASLDKNELESRDLTKLYNYFMSKNQTSEAIAVLREMGSVKNYDKLLAECWKKRLKILGLGELWDSPDCEFTVSKGKFNVKIINSEYDDLSPLKGMPINSLLIRRCPISSLEFVRGMPLKNLSIFRTEISSINSLKDMKLEVLQLRSTNISNINVLKGMNTLKELNISATGVADISPLKDLKLRKLSLSYTPISDISVLEDMNIIVLTASHTSISDISVLKGHMLRTLDLAGTSVRDISPLQGTKSLTKLTLSSTQIKSLDSLKNLKLNQLFVRNTPIRNLTALAGQPLETLDIRNTNVSDLEPISELNLKNLFISNTFVRELPKFKHKNLEILDVANLSLKNLKNIQNFKRLENLNIANTNTSNLWTFSKLPLKNLNISQNKSIKDLNPLSKMPLRHLDMEEIGEIDITPLKNISSLKSLNVSFNKITSLIPLEKSNIEILNIFQSDAVLQPLLNMPKLREIYLNRTLANSDIISQLKALQTITINLKRLKTADLIKEL